MKATQKGLSSTKLCSITDLLLTPQFQGKSWQAYRNTQRGAWEGGHPHCSHRKTFLEANVEELEVKLLMSPEPWACGVCEVTDLEQKQPSA